MRFFRSEPPTPVKTVTPTAKPPIIEGWSENELVSVYHAAPVKHYRKGEAVFTDITHSDSFFVLVDGAINVTVKLHGQPGRPGIFKRGDCIAQLPLANGLLYTGETAMESTIIEISPTIMKHLSEKTQLCIYKVATAS